MSTEIGNICDSTQLMAHNYAPKMLLIPSKKSICLIYETSQTMVSQDHQSVQMQFSIDDGRVLHSNQKIVQHGKFTVMHLHLQTLENQA